MIFLWDCFGIFVWLNYYLYDEFKIIIVRVVDLFKLIISDDGVCEIVMWLCGMLCVVEWLF